MSENKRAQNELGSSCGLRTANRYAPGVTFKDGNGPFFPFMPNVDLVILTARGQKVFIQTAKTGMNCVEPLSHTCDGEDKFRQ